MMLDCSHGYCPIVINIDNGGGVIMKLIDWEVEDVKFEEVAEFTVAMSWCGILFCGGKD